MTHLGSRISALADGRLDADARERALAHVAACPACAEELAATRAARRALADAREADVPVAPDLTDRLLALGLAALTDADPAPRARRAPEPLGGGPVLGLRPLLSRPPRDDVALDGGALGGSALGGRVLASVSPWSLAAVTVGALAVGLFLLGEERLVVPDSHPAADLALLAGAAAPAEAAADVAEPLAVGLSAAGPGPALAATGAASDAGVTGAAAWPAGDWLADWVVDGVPDGYVVVGTSGDGARSVVDLDGPAGPVVVLRQEGRLSAAVLDGVAPTTIGAHEVRVLAHAPWHAVVEVGDDVVAVVAAHRTAGAESVVAALPARAADGGLGARMSRGWQVLVGAWGP